jgi:hypothetical protein
MSPTHLRANFTLCEVVPPPAESDWVPSPLPGVECHMLVRIGGEVARATTVVRYAPGFAFDRHVHGGVEEFLVQGRGIGSSYPRCPT